MKKEKKNREQSSIKRKRFRFNISRIIVTVIVVILIAVVGVSLKNVISLHSEQSQLQATNKQLKKDKASLKDELKNVNDFSYIEEQARIQLRLIKPGETLYILNNDKDTEEGKNEKN